MITEETPRVLNVFIWEEHSYAIFFRHWSSAIVVSPYDGKEEGSGGAHDGDVREHPASIIAWERVDYFEEEGMVGNASHGVVRDTCGHCSAHPGRVDQERVETSLAPLFLLDSDLQASG